MNTFYLSLGIIVVVLIVLHLINTNTKVDHLDDYEDFSGSVDIVPLSDSPQMPSNNDVPQVQNNKNNINLDKYVRRTDVEMAAREAALQFCPVPPDYDPSQYIKKTELKNTIKCPPMPDLKDYVLKSSIPPIQKCPPCVCPKVKVEAGLCKKCPPPNLNCPRPEPCPEPPVKVCPAIKIPKQTLKCPPPKPCPRPAPCPRTERCPPQNCPSCKYYGIKKVYKPHPPENNNQNVVEQQQSELLNDVPPEEEFAPVVAQVEKLNNGNNNKCEVPADFNSNKIIGSIFN